MVDTTIQPGWITAALRASLLGYGRILSQYGTNQPLFSKGVEGGVDACTSLDKELERDTRSYLSKETGIPCFGEEEGGSKDSELLWILDKIDGTPNWRSGIPCFGSAVALARGDEPIINAILLPALGEIYVAMKGQGSHFIDIGRINREANTYANNLRGIIQKNRKLGRRLSTFQEAIESIEQCLVDEVMGAWNAKDANDAISQLEPILETDPKKMQFGTDLGYKDRFKKLQKMGSFSDDVFYCPVLGSASFSLCQVAAGKLGGYWIPDVDINDTYPGSLLVTEMGGIVTDQKRNPMIRTSTGLVAGANKELYQFLMLCLESFRDIYGMPFMIDPCLAR